MIKLLKRSWLPILGILSIAVTTAIMMFFQLPSHSLLWRELQNSGHTLAFAGITLMLRLALSQKSLQKGSRSLLNLQAFVIALIIGIAIESIHFFTPRDASLGDIALNTLGSVIGLLISIVFTAPDKTLAWRAIPLVFAGLILSLCFRTPFKIWQALHYQKQQFPILQTFDSQLINTLTKPVYYGKLNILPAPKKWLKNNSKVLMVEFPQSIWPGAKISEPTPGWQDYDILRFDIFSEEKEAFYVILRINDKQHNNQHRDRYNRKLTIHPGLNEFFISIQAIENAPKNRLMDLDNIKQIIWYMHKPDKSYRFYLDNVQLITHSDN